MKKIFKVTKEQQAEYIRESYAVSEKEKGSWRSSWGDFNDIALVVDGLPNKPEFTDERLDGWNCEGTELSSLKDNKYRKLIKEIKFYKVGDYDENTTIEQIIRDLELEDFECEYEELVKKEKPVSPVAILNCAILTNVGDFKLSNITLEQAQELTKGEILSAVGHQSTSDILTELLQVNVPMNRIQFEQQSGQKAVVFKLNGRAPEGAILTKEQIEEIGYSFQLLEML